MRARLGDGPVYVSVDIDVLDPAHAPGTGTPEAGGLTSRELLHTLRALVGHEHRRRRHRRGRAGLRPRRDHRHRRGARRATSCCRCWRPGSRVTDHRNGGAAVVETLRRARRRHGLRHPRHPQPGAVPAPARRPGSGRSPRATSRAPGTPPTPTRGSAGGPGVVVTTSGPGLTNAMTAAATAYAESRPVLLLSPGVPDRHRGRDLGQLHETKDSTRRAWTGCVAWSRRVSPRRRGRRRRGRRRSRRSAARRPRPVHVEIPLDVLEEPWTRHRRAAAAAAAAPTPDRAADAARGGAARQCPRPLVIAGGGAVDAAGRRCGRWPRHSARRSLPRVNGKGVLDEGHPLSVGASVRLRALQQAAAASDVGARRRQRAGRLRPVGRPRSRGRAVIRVDIDAGQLHKNAAPTSRCTATPPRRCGPR